MSLNLEVTLAPMPSTTRGRPGCIDYTADRRRFAYPNETNVILRSIDNETDFDVFTGHRAAVTSVKFSPNGAYCASGDASGLVLVWDTINREEHIVKLEKPTLSGPVTSIDWSGDGQRLVAGGEGKEFMAVAFSLDGSGLGELGGHGKRVNAVSFRRERPYRIVTASDDMCVNFYQGPPFKFVKSHVGIHNKQVNDVTFCPSGKYAVSVASDKKMSIIDGKTGEFISEFPSAAKGSIYRAVFSPAKAPVDKEAEPEFMATVGADKTVTIYKWADKSVVTTYTVGKTTTDMTVAVAWTPEGLLVVTLDGIIRLLTFNGSELALARTYGGHQSPVVSCVVAADGTVVSGDRAGGVVAWNVGTAHGTNVGVYGTTEMRSLELLSNGTIEGRNSSQQVELFTAAAGTATHTGTQAMPVIALQTGRSTDGKVTAYITQDNSAMFNGKIVALPGRAKATACAVAADGAAAAFGTSTGKIYTVDSTGAVDRELVFHPNEVTVLAYADDGTLFSGDKSKRITAWAPGAEEETYSALEFHNGRVRALAPAPGRTDKWVSGGNDGYVIVWSAEGKVVKRQSVFAHNGGVFAVAWLDSDRVISAGDDGCLRVWKL